MHFKAGESKPKATLEIGSKTYQIKSPLVGQQHKLAADISQAASSSEQSELMKKFICELGQIPMEDLEKIEQDTFNALFEHVVSSPKKS